MMRRLDASRLTLLWIAAFLVVSPAHAVQELASPTQLGRALYQGFRAWKLGDQATNNGLPAEYTACVACHGPTGDGGSEAGIEVPTVRWSALLNNTEQGIAYPDAKAVLTAIEQGIGRGGRSLGATMPRFRLSEQERQALLSYLTILGTTKDNPVGVDAETIRIGALLPLQGESATIGESVLAGLHVSIDAANHMNGIYGRKLELIVEPVSLTEQSILKGLQYLLNNKRVYALIGSFTDLPNTAAENRLESSLASARVADIAPLSQPLQNANAGPSWRAPLFPDLQEQRTLLQQTLQRRCPDSSGERILTDANAAPIDTSINVFDSPDALLNSIDDSDRDRKTPVGKLRVISLAGAESTRQLQDQLIHRLNQNVPSSSVCIGYLPFRAGVLANSPPEWTEVLVSPVPQQAFLMAKNRRTDIWRLLGEWAGQILVEGLAQAGPSLYERALLDVLPALQHRLPAGITLNYRRDHLYGFQAAVTMVRSATRLPVQETHVRQTEAVANRGDF